MFLKKDVREMGSGNAGTTNVMRTGGFKLGAITFLGDVLKGFVACYLGKLIFKTVFENGAIYNEYKILGYDENYMNARDLTEPFTAHFYAVLLV